MYIRPEYHEDGIYHVYNRGVAKLPMFLKETDYFDFREIMRYYLVGFPKREVSDTSHMSKKKLAEDVPVSWKADPAGNGMFHGILDLLAHCLMPNHFHFLIHLREVREVSDTSLSAISEFIKRLSITYAHKFNQDNDRVGPIFQGRFKIKEVNSNELATHVVRYIHINPTMAGLVKKPEDWKWSDINDYYNFQPMRVGTVTKPLLVMEMFNRRPQDYREFVEAQFSDEDSKFIAPATLELEP